MEDVRYRDVERSDYQDIRELIDNTWNFHAYIKGKKMLYRALDIYVRDCLKSSTFGLVAEVQGSFAGILLGHA